MRIGIDARFLTHPQPGGFKTYTTNIISALITLEQDHEWILIIDRPKQELIKQNTARVEYKIIKPKGGWANVPLREQIQIPAYLHRYRPDIIHFPCNTGSILATHPSVVTIHDSIEFLTKISFSQLPVAGMKRALMVLYNKCVQRIVAQRADVVITDSNHSKLDITTYLKVPEHKIRVIPIAHADDFRPLHNKDTLNKLCISLNIPHRFIFALASASPRKNTIGLLRIYSLIPRELKRRYPLVILWSHPLLKNNIQREIQKLELSNYVHNLASVSDKELVLLYNAASLFVFPSLYEGFGLPVLEAMACGTPVVASNLTSIPEVAGDGAVLTNPHNEETYANLIVNIIKNNEIQKSLIKAGLIQSRKFSWRKTAKLTLEVYREVAERRVSDKGSASRFE